MADGRQVLDDLTRIRLKLLQQKIRNRKASTPALPQTNPHHLLQAEILKNQQLVERLKEKRQFGHPRAPSHEDKDAKDMMTMMMAQNMQLQQMMMQQMLHTIPQDKNPAYRFKTYQHNRQEEQQHVEIPEVGLREMTPFTSLAQGTSAHPGTAFRRAQSALAAPDQRLLRHQVRGIATPVRPTGFSRAFSTQRPSGGFLGQPVDDDHVIENTYPYPGNRKIRKLRHVCYAAWACFILLSHLKQATRRRLDTMARLDALILQTIDELHKKHYLQSGNLVHLSLMDMVKDNFHNMNVKNPGVFRRLSREEQQAVDDLSMIVESIIDEITRLQVPDGLLSATRDGILWVMIQNEVFFPPNYLWNEEKKFLEFTDRGAVIKVDDQASVMLILGLVVSRGFVSTLLLKPIQYGLTEDVPNQMAGSNLKVLGSVLMKIVREVSVTPKEKPMPLAAEISSQLFSDEDMKFTYKKLDSIITWSKTNLRNWANSYVESVRCS